jgi:glycerol-3-phosphate cytidylyltransferase
MKVLTVGTFDLLHPGHLELFDICHQIANGGTVVVGVNTDRFIIHYRGRPPAIRYTHRAAVIAALRNVDQVLPNSQPNGSMLGLIDQVAPDVLVVGGDWLDRHYLEQIGVTAEQLNTRSISLMYAARPVDGPSSTRIKEAMQ